MIGSSCKVVIKSSSVREWAVALAQLAENNRVSLLWIPGHSGIRSSTLEEANRLVLEGLRCSDRTIVHPLNLAPSVTKRWVKDWTRTQLAQFWASETGLKHSKALVKGPSRELVTKLSRMVDYEHQYGPLLHWKSLGEPGHPSGSQLPMMRGGG